MQTLVLLNHFPVHCSGSASPCSSPPFHSLPNISSLLALAQLSSSSTHLASGGHTRRPSGPLLVDTPAQATTTPTTMSGALPVPHLPLLTRSSPRRCPRTAVPAAPVPCLRARGHLDVDNATRASSSSPIVSGRSPPLHRPLSTSPSPRTSFDDARTLMPTSCLDGRSATVDARRVPTHPGPLSLLLGHPPLRHLPSDAPDTAT